MNELKGLPVAAVAEKHRFDEAGLQTYLTKHVENFGSNMRVQQFQGGASNPTFLLETDVGECPKRYVLRKKPPGKLLPSAHQVDREYKFMQALAGSAVPVPNVRHLCQDDAIIGTDFYLMDFINARIINDAGLPDDSAASRGPMHSDSITCLANLHRLDFEAVGLKVFDRPGGFLERQLSRFTKQYRAAETETIGEMEALIDYLHENLPEEEPKAIFHGDYRMGNLMFHPTEPRLIAVLDWELATIGNPLVDLAYYMFPWIAPIGPYGYVADSAAKTGLPSREDTLRTYCRLTGRDGISNFNFYVAFSLFRLASISQGVARRVEAGNVSRVSVFPT